MKSRQILVVEDSPGMRQLLYFALMRIERVTIEEAANGLEALQMLMRNSYDLALVDINMPVMDGLKLISTLRKDDRLKHLPVVVVTACSGEEDRDRALLLGANAYITKPISTSALTRVVTQLLEGRRVDEVSAPQP